MKPETFIALLVSLAVLALFVLAFRAESYGFCGMKPIKPVPPVGCRDMVAECVCDSYGRNCYWIWRCVR